MWRAGLGGSMSLGGCPCVGGWPWGEGVDIIRGVAWYDLDLYQ